MSDSNPPKLERRFNLRTPLVFALLVLSGCGPTKEQQAVDAYNRGVAHAEKSEFDKAVADFTEAIRLSPNYADALLWQRKRLSWARPFGEGHRRLRRSDPA